MKTTISKVSSTFPKQLFDLLPSPRSKFFRVYFGKALTGQFQIRHIGCRTFLAARSFVWRLSTLGFEFVDTGDLFRAESSGCEWTRVIQKDDLV
jgi:hypothetical protein